ncbi:MAG: type II toxin-antitoxin system MqsA family antitoxin [Oligoflexia bacterium]|nr:type II toxin-antitoxin system MqsA family antitoxin [Oligoflexia bacterium]
MKCTSCGAEMLPPTRKDGVPYPCGLRDALLNGVLVHECPECGEEEVDVPRPLELHRCLAQAVAIKPGRLAPEEIRFLRKHLGWSGVDFARRFRVTAQTVSRWEQGKIGMNMQAELLLRMLAPTLPPISAYPDEGAVPDDHQVPRMEIVQRLLDDWSEAVDDPDTPIAMDLRGGTWVGPDAIREVCC